MQYEAVIGLEVHVQLATKSKLFCGCSTEFGAEANTHVCPVCMGLPGALPMLNKEAVNQAVRAGLALGCDIQKVSTFDRKNYFYPDLPKAYQITQMYRPICLGGQIIIEPENSEKRAINVTRIHIEEDAGKLVHGENIGASDSSYVDLNRSSMPLVEIVGEPELRTPEEARLYMQKLHTILLYAGVSDCNMEEGSMRCDANVSIRPAGETKFGTRVEIKNMNSFRNVQRAVEYEIKRQERALRDGEKIRQETRLWDNDKQHTFPMRSKEDAHDYRYFPDADLLPVIISSELIEELRKGLPEMPDPRKNRFIAQYGLPKYDAELLTSEKSYADFYEEALQTHNNPKPVANWIMSEVLRVVNDKKCNIFDAGITPKNLALLVKSVDDSTISGKQGKDLFTDVISTGISPLDIIRERGMAQVSDTGELETIVKSVIDQNPAEAERFRNGDKKLQGFFVGQIMKASQGKANPKIVNELLQKLLG